MSSHIMVDERALRVHQVKLVVNARENFGNGGAVGDPDYQLAWDQCRSVGTYYLKTESSAREP